LGLAGPFYDEILGPVDRLPGPCKPLLCSFVHRAHSFSTCNQCIVDDAYLAADQSRIMQDQMTGPAMGMPPDPSKAFKVYFILEIY